MSTFDLITLHLRLECKEINVRGDLIPVPCPNPDSVPRFYIAQHTDDGTFSRFAWHDVPEELRQRLLAIPPIEALHQHEYVRRILAPYGTSDDLHYGKSYLCPKPATFDDCPRAVRLTEAHGDLIQEYDSRIDPAGNAVFAVIEDGRIVSTCESSRENETAAEAWVRTLREYRGHGLAKQVTAAWAAHVWGHGKLPFYSHRLDNLASGGVARGMGMKPFIIDAAYS